MSSLCLDLTFRALALRSWYMIDRKWCIWLALVGTILLPEDFLNGICAITMRFKWSDHIPWSGLQENTVMGTNLKAPSVATECPKRWSWFEAMVFSSSLMSIIPWAVNAKDKFHMPTTVNKELKRRARYRAIDSSASNRSPGLRFRPYVSKVPWHTAVRALLSQLFPRYGHYCGPNWSSGKNGGSLIWDKRLIDWLDYCCYCHDMGYDTIWLAIM
ncbi:hypothetical protein Cgig2_027888 [Carnegiea gigantea]|uniref:Uncharacterized protein n=1 Tax=Carnegiea gigantea TaxID=171969 RepID=A0A9Q1KM55_9CARY|nr:hypothetical protein Cgig2_027888 [Carnegiea gigantea]